MKKVIILQGLPASGKSTWAKQQIDENKGMYKRVNKDDLRLMLDNGNWSQDNEKFILKIRDEIILKSLENGKHIIVDDTNLAPKHIEHIKQLIKGLAEIEVKFFEIDIDEAIKRDLKRTISVGEKVIQDMYDRYLKPIQERYIPSINLPKAFIFDIDGTLAKMNDRSPFDWDKVNTDIINEPVVRLLDDLSKLNYNIIIFTGRDGICEEKTKKWLADNNIFYDYFAIRKTGDNRKDAIVKKEFFDEVKNKYNILGVFDDRKQVVEMWRSIGLTCYQVNEGNF